MCSRCCFKEIIPSLEVKISNNPSSLACSQFTIYAFGRTTFIELAVSYILISSYVTSFNLAYLVKYNVNKLGCPPSWIHFYSHYNGDLSDVTSWVSHIKKNFFCKQQVDARHFANEYNVRNRHQNIT